MHYESKPFALAFDLGGLHNYTVKESKPFDKTSLACFSVFVDGEEVEAFEATTRDTIKTSYQCAVSAMKQRIYIDRVNPSHGGSIRTVSGWKPLRAPVTR